MQEEMQETAALLTAVMARLIDLISRHDWTLNKRRKVEHEPGWLAREGPFLERTIGLLEPVVD